MMTPHGFYVIIPFVELFECIRNITWFYTNRLHSSDSRISGLVRTNLLEIMSLFSYFRQNFVVLLD